MAICVQDSGDLERGNSSRDPFLISPLLTFLFVHFLLATTRAKMLTVTFSRLYDSSPLHTQSSKWQMTGTCRHQCTARPHVSTKTTCGTTARAYHVSAYGDNSCSSNCAHLITLLNRISDHTHDRMDGERSRAERADRTRFRRICDDGAARRCGAGVGAFDHELCTGERRAGGWLGSLAPRRSEAGVTSGCLRVNN